MRMRTGELARETITTLSDVAAICERAELPTAAKKLRELAEKWRMRHEEEVRTGRMVRPNYGR